jgi:hypothetical protein
MEGPIDDESLPTKFERKNAPSPTGTSASLRRKISKRTNPWSAARVETLPSTSTWRDEGIPMAKIPRLTVPLSATAEESVTNTASSHAEEDIPPAYAHANPMTAMQLKASVNRAPPSALTLLENETIPTHELEPTDQRKHNSINEYRKECPAFAPMAPAPTSMQLRGLSGWHPSQPNIYPTTGFTGTSIADQVNIQQTLYGVNGHASAAIRDPGQTTSRRSNGWNPWGSTWHPNIAQAAGITDLLGTRLADQVHILQILNGINGHAGTVARGPVQTTSPCSNRWSPHWSSAYHPTITQSTGQTCMQTADQGSILEIQQNSNNRYLRTAVRGPGQTTSSYSNGLSIRESAWLLAITQATDVPGLPGTRTSDQTYLLETRQKGLHWDASLLLEPRQATTSPYQNRLDKAVDTPVDQTTGRASRRVTEGTDIDRTTQRKGNWTADEDKELIRAVEKFSVTRWKQIAALIPGRTKKQCWNRWQYALDPSVVRMTERTGKWSAEEDDRLVAAAEKYKGKNWDSIAALVPSRTKRQCMDRWHKCKSWTTACADD